MSETRPGPASDLAPEAFERLRRGLLGRPYRWARTCPSTQELLRDPSLPEGAVAVAEHQTAGRGRLGRTWEDEAGRALLCSVLLRPERQPLPQLSLVAALAVAEAIEEETGCETAVKWPNDVLVGGRKVAGILLEASGGSVIVGIGVNVNQTAEELPATARHPPCSLRTATARAHDRGVVLAAVLGRLELRYAAWSREGLPPLVPHLEARNCLRGREVVVDGSAGRAGRIAPEGGLEVRLSSGEAIVVGSGEVELLGEPLELGRRVGIGEHRLVDQ